ncbi:hypothetical protein [Cerasicoccus frondis]|uniref:hypothetical protein n=1 Tax=Cerasicoccus frondis TaxID=490090 RepID=UPI0028529382|nr:hypothetical protein [Cerasicoccus frondis]
MNGNSYISEAEGTGSFAQINLGDGSLGTVGANTGDADGGYNINERGSSTPTQLGSDIDVFPREENFEVGFLSYDAGAITGSGVETTAITDIDLSAFWTADPNRTSSSPDSAPTVISDISDYALGLWFFNYTGSITFGALDAGDTVTFTNGVLTSIDLDLDTAFVLDVFGTGESEWNGNLTIAGLDFSYQINETEVTAFGPITFTADLAGTVTPTVVPEPGVYALLAGFASFAALVIRRRPSKS